MGNMQGGMCIPNQLFTTRPSFIILLKLTFYAESIFMVVVVVVSALRQ